MTFERAEALKNLKSVSQPAIVHEGDFPNNQTFRVFTDEGGYLAEFDESPVTGPYEMSDDDYEEAQKILNDDGSEGYFDPDDIAVEMVKDDCEPGIRYFRYKMAAIAEEPIFSENLSELTEWFIQDVIENLDCQGWDDMSDEDLEDWQRWYEFGKSSAQIE